MKKITPLTNTVVVILTIFTTVNAQKKPVAFNSAPPAVSLLSPFKDLGFGKTNANAFNIRAVRDFVKTFKTAINNKWLLAEDGGSTAIFTSDGINTMVAYNKKGCRQYIIRIYDESRMAFSLRDMVKREYYDATITIVKEVETNDGVVIFVHMQDKDTWKIVRVAGGEMKLVENLNKG